MNVSSSHRIRGRYRKVKGQPTVDCAHCGARKNYLSTWRTAHVGRVCYNCIKSGTIQLFKEVSNA